MKEYQENLLSNAGGFASGQSSTGNKNLQTSNKENSEFKIPQITLPKGGGAIKSIDEKFSVNAVNGTAGFSLPLPVSDARGFSPSLSLGYNSGSGNGIFGLGWSISL